MNTLLLALTIAVLPVKKDKEIIKEKMVKAKIESARELITEDGFHRIKISD